MDNYCIKPEYRHGSGAHTLVEEISSYWNAKRVSASGSYQWDVYLAAAAYLSAHPGTRFADVGCGYPTKVRQLIETVTAEIKLFDQPSMASAIAKEFPEFTFIPMDLECPPDHGDRFGCIVCADVIEHLLNPDPLLKFLQQMLDTGGLLFLSTPERDALRGENCVASPKRDHVREWNFGEFRAYLESRGLQILDHRRVPPKKLNRLQNLLPEALRTAFPARFGSCQVAICRV